MSHGTGVLVLDPFDLARVLGSGAAVALTFQLGRLLVVWMQGRTRVAEIEALGKADVARIEATSKMLRSLAELEPEQAERLRGRLERVRPPPEELQPPAAS
jgi:hypothetical protein